jgi:GNAT superfamily N-acetyltransferase
MYKPSEDFEMPPSSHHADRVAELSQLRLATVDDVPRLAAMLAAAFYDDPTFEWLLPDDGTRQIRLRRFFEIELRAVGLARGRVWTTSDLTGAAISTPPRRWRLPWRAQLADGLAFTRAFGRRLPHAGWLLQRIEARHPRSAHHYFPAIGVAPAQQGQGLGSALMSPTLQRCDEEALPAYLEASSERNAALYERLGFELIEELRYGGSQPLRLMLRPQRARRQFETSDATSRCATAPQDGGGAGAAIRESAASEMPKHVRLPRSARHAHVLSALVPDEQCQEAFLSSSERLHGTLRGSDDSSVGVAR